jgi:hypothetical protein
LIELEGGPFLQREANKEAIYVKGKFLLFLLVLCIMVIGIIIMFADIEVYDYVFEKSNIIIL